MNHRKPAMSTFSKRLELERKIMVIFEAARGMEAADSGIGKYTIKRTLMLNDKAFKISINTVKRIVDELVKSGIVECVNSDAKTNLRFRLVGMRFRIVGGQHG